MNEGAQALKKGVEAYIPLAEGIARRTYSNVIILLTYSNLDKFEPLFTLQDCKNAAYIGLVDAYKRYDPNKGASFKTFMQKRVRGEVIDQITKFFHIPRSVFSREIKQRGSAPKTYRLEDKCKGDGDGTELKDRIRGEVDSYFDKIDNVDEILFLLKGFSKNEKNIFIYHHLCGNKLEQTAEIAGVGIQTAWNASPKVMERVRKKAAERNLSYADFVS
jgi:RNA polymerase sigma factor (sigma-70 family)